RPSLCATMPSGSAPRDSLLDALLLIGTMHDAVHIDRGSVHLVRIDCTYWHKFLDLGNRHLAARCGDRIEVPRGLAIHQVAGCVPAPCLDQRHISYDAALE